MHSHPTGHAHDHDHGGRATPEGRVRAERAMWIVLALVASYMVAEIVGGIASGSLALLADAGHMASDVASLALTLFASWIARRPASPKRTFGYYRAEILAALVNGAALFAIAAFIVVEAVNRLRAPAPIAGATMLAVAAGGLAVNLASLWILSGSRAESLNLRGAWLHVMADALGSVGAITAGVLVWRFGWTWADPVASVVIAVLVVVSSIGLLRQSVHVLMEGAPADVDVDEVRRALSAAPGVAGVHDLHVWTISNGLESLSAHVVTDPDVDSMRVLGDLHDLLSDRFGIDHVTIQIEAAPCERAGHASSHA